MSVFPRCKLCGAEHALGAPHAFERSPAKSQKTPKLDWSDKDPDDWSLEDRVNFVNDMVLDLMDRMDALERNVTHNATVTPNVTQRNVTRNGNAERQRRYRERKKQQHEQGH